MKNLLGLALLVVAVISGSANAGERVGDFALIDHRGAIQHMAWYNDHRAVVIMPMTKSQDDAASFKALQETYAEQGVQFFLLNPGLHSDRALVQSEVVALGLDLPVLMDDAQLVTEMLGVSHVDQAVLYDPSSFELLYRGPIANMEATLKKALAGENSNVVSVASNGPAIDFANIDAHANLSYEKDIAPIIAENCASCHRNGGIAPFAMDSRIAV